MSRVIQIVHLSDLHICSDLDTVKLSSPGLSDAGQKVQVLGRYIAKHFPNAHVVVTGDVTDCGTTTSVRLAKNLLRRFMARGKLHVVPGNHDCGTKGSLSYSRSRRRNFHRNFADALPGTHHYPWVKRLGHVALIGLDTTSADDWFAEGRIGTRQLKALDAHLQQAHIDRLLPVVLMHHDPWYEGILCSLTDGKEFISVMKKHRMGPGPLVLFGHGHQTRLRRHVAKYTRESASITYMASPSSVDLKDSRMRFRVITLELGGQIRSRWDACPWQEKYFL
jgi:3',5'-cyclic AMP phosphodiesterase CpdA